MTRGREANHAYVDVDVEGEETAADVPPQAENRFGGHQTSLGRLRVALDNRFITATSVPGAGPVIRNLPGVGEGHRVRVRHGSATTSSTGNGRVQNRRAAV